jgi:GrpB-like predicted nucleotidyltransferase (UPF0157 family)
VSYVLNGTSRNNFSAETVERVLAAAAELAYTPNAAARALRMGTLPACVSTGLVLRAREEGHLLLWPPPASPREVHVHVCNSGGDWGRDELLFRDYLAANAAVRDEYAALKRELMTRWHDDRQAHGEAKTAFILDALEDARA